ncbi:MAG: hypothetical protein HYY16_15985 [Planctomycetes bacterium]|nr:hypothetical protein [Planctomycetota bacterium]
MIPSAGLVGAIALLVVGFRPGQEDPPTPSTSRFVPLHQIVIGLLREAEREGDAERPCHVLWLIDLSDAARRDGQLSEIAGVIEEAKLDWAKVRMGVATLGPTTSRALEFTADVSSVAQRFRELQGRSDASGAANLGENIQQAAKMIGRNRKGLLAVWTQTKLEGEMDLEDTISQIEREMRVVSVTPDALYSNPFGRMTPSQSERGQWMGPESPFPEFPSQWLFSDIEPLYTVPSGFAPYSLRRFGVKTGGTNATYTPPADYRSFCEIVGCALCAGRHMECALGLDEGKMKVLEPFAGSRGGFLRLSTSDPMWSAVYQAWHSLLGAGIVNSSPPVVGGRVMPPFGAPGQRLTFTCELATEKLIVKEMLGGLQNIVQQIEQAITLDRGRSDKRAGVSAEAMLVYAKIARFNLGQLLLFLDEMAGLVKRRRGAIEFGDDVFDYYAHSHGGPYTGYTYECVYLCHASTGSFLGKPQELTDLLKDVRAFIERHRGTPYELLVRHANLAVFIPTRENRPDTLWHPSLKFRFEPKYQPTGGISAPRIPTLPGRQPPGLPGVPTTGSGGSAFGSNRPSGAPAPSGGGGTATGQ